jgi:hypothetical protein
MKRILQAVACLILTLVLALTAAGQSTPPAPSVAKEQPAAAQAQPAARTEGNQKNVLLLSGLSDLQLQRTMNLIATSLGVRCDFCHVRAEDGWHFDRDEKETKKAARDMIRMVQQINQTAFRGHPDVSCNTCHRGATRPMSVPSLPVAEVTPPAQATDKSTFPTAADLFAKYAAAVGGPDAKALLDPSRGRSMKGTRESSDGKTTVPIEILEAAPDRQVITVTMPEGTMVQAIDVASAWLSTPREVRLMRSGERENFQQLVHGFDPVVPGDAPEKARVLGKDKIGDREAWVVGYMPSEHQRVRLYFDATSGLVLRRSILTDGPIGQLPEQTDFDDYREVGGAKVPFHVRLSIVDPRVSSTRRYSEVKLGVPVGAAKFAMPAK